MGRADQWGAGFRASVRAARQGWTVNNKAGQIQLKVRRPGSPQQTKILPLTWSPQSQAPALQLIGRIFKLVEGQQESLHRACEICLGASDTLKPERSWPAIAASLKDSLQSGRNEIQEQTWTTNYKPYIEEALRLLSSGKPPKDGHDLLKQALKKWAGKPPSRATCCIALRNLTDHGVTRFHLEAFWRMDRATIKELKGRPAKKKPKATLDDREILYLINGVDRRNPAWANILRLMALYGLRPIELQHLRPKIKEDGTLGLWCSYEKNCGGSLTDPRWLEACPLTDIDGMHCQWNLAGALHAGVLEFPIAGNGGIRQLNGHYVALFLERQPEWKELKAKATERGEWLRPYTFRDSYSLRCHRHRIEVGAIAMAMGHSLAVHSSSYRWASQATTSEAFSRALRN